MIFRIILICLFLISGLIWRQNNELFTYKYDSIVKSLHYKSGDIITVYTQFEVNNDGDIINITARGPQKIFEDKAIELAEDLPKYNPSILKGKPIGNKFNLPFVFIIQDEKNAAVN